VRLARSLKPSFHPRFQLRHPKRLTFEIVERAHHRIQPTTKTFRTEARLLQTPLFFFVGLLLRKQRLTLRQRIRAPEIRDRRPRPCGIFWLIRLKVKALPGIG